MKISVILPARARAKYFKNIKEAGIKISPDEYLSRSVIYGLFFSIVIGIIFHFIGNNIFIAFFISSVVLQIISYFWVSLKASSQVHKMENAFPDFIQLMASNLRSGMTIDRAFLLSARPEF